MLHHRLQMIRSSQLTQSARALLLLVVLLGLTPDPSSGEPLRGLYLLHAENNDSYIAKLKSGGVPQSLLNSGGKDCRAGQTFACLN